MSAKVERIVTKCETCGADVALTPGQRARPGSGRFCSKRCKGVASAVAMNATRRPPSEYATPPVLSGPDNPRWVPPVPLSCRSCGGSFDAKPHRVGGPESRGVYCSNACRDQYRRDHESGPDSPFWVGGARTYRGRGWKQTRAVVVTEQGGKCADCGRLVGDSLPVNHKIPFRHFDTPEAANVRSNLVGLCQSCHMKAEPRRDNLFGHKSTP